MKIMTTGSLLSHARMSQTYHLHMPLTYCALYKMSVLQSWQLDTPPSELATKPESYDIGHSDEIIPALLYNFLALVLLGEEKCNINVHYDDTHDAMKKVETAASIHRRILVLARILCLQRMVIMFQLPNTSCCHLQYTTSHGSVHRLSTSY